MAYGNYLDSQEIRSKLEKQTQEAIHRSAQVDNKTKLETALSLHHFYSEKVNSRKEPVTTGLIKQGRALPRITLHV
jgi:hypothetical protein